MEEVDSPLFEIHFKAKQANKNQLRKSEEKARREKIVEKKNLEVKRELTIAALFQVKLVEKSLAEAAAGAASTMLARQQRNGRRYDVPQIGELQHHQFFKLFRDDCTAQL